MTTVRTAGAYRQLWHTPRLPGVIVLAFLARLPLGMITVALLLYVRQTADTFAVAGLAVAVFAVVIGISSPAKGALFDRFGHRPVLVLTAAVATTGLVLLVWLRPTSAAVLLAVSALIGVGTPPVSAVARAGYARLLDGDRQRAAYGLDAVAMELVYLVGPALVGLVVATGGGPGGALLLAAGLTAVATVGFALCAPDLATREPHEPGQPGSGQPESGPAGPTRSGRTSLARTVRYVIAAATPQAAALGLGEVVVTAAAVAAGQRAVVGILLGVWAAGSIVGGLVFGALSWSWRPIRQYAALLLALTVGMALLAVPHSLSWLGVVLFVAGLPTSAAWAAGAAVLAGAPESERGRAYGWLQGTTNGGAAAGYALGGVCVGLTGLTGGYLIGAALAAVACGTVLSVARSRPGAEGTN